MTGLKRNGQRRALRLGGLTLAVVVLWVWLSLATGNFN